MKIYIAKKNPASSSISRLSRLCRRSPVRTLQQPAGSSSLIAGGCSTSALNSGRSSLSSQDWISFPSRQMSEYPPDFGSFVGESFLVVDGIENSRQLQQQHHYQQHHHQHGHHSAQGSSLFLQSQQHHLRSESISPEPVPLRLIEPSSSGLAYLERGII